ncbi:MAG: 6-phosphogluconolactonase [Paludibacter sp.]|nr:6-phosphogluconolactonase [Paludibacter sp.]
MNSNVHIFETNQDTARGVAELIRVKAKEKNKLSLPLNIALSGGNTPKLLFNLLAKEYVDTILWHFIRLFWVDERCVPPTHIESNYGMTYEHLLKNVPIHDSNVFPIQGDIDPATESVRYQNTLKLELPSRNGIPKFDLILLGMGDDGHTASIFPNDLSLLHSDQLVAVSVHPESNQKRITLTGQIINEADDVVFLITGASKADVLKKIIHREPSFENYPASYIHAQSVPAHFYLDKAAAEKL